MCFKHDWVSFRSGLVFEQFNSNVTKSHLKNWFELIWNTKMVFRKWKKFYKLVIFLQKVGVISSVQGWCLLLLLHLAMESEATKSNFIDNKTLLIILMASFKLLEILFSSMPSCYIVGKWFTRESNQTVKIVWNKFTNTDREVISVDSCKRICLEFQISENDSSMRNFNKLFWTIAWVKGM